MSDVTDQAKPRHSLRQLLVLTAILAMYFAVLGWAIRNCSPGRADILPASTMIFAAIVTAVELIRWRSRVVKGRSVGKHHGLLMLASPLYTEVRNSLPIVAVLLLLALFDFDSERLADYFVFTLPLAGVVVGLNCAFMRTSTVTDQGLLTRHGLKSWDLIRFEGHNGEMLISWETRETPWWRQPCRYAVPTSLQPVVKNLLSKASSNRSEETDDLPRATAPASSAGASPS